ncbi:hypothetical protein LCGC14_1316880 [marine sediment metagenome]|uniref:Uncharacterized protein n=1 Tax=marine sediment metagenome TaxID=412755 RepID=A0A0F9L604_9ZZZZ
MTWQEIAGLVSFGIILLFFAFLFGICAAFFIWLMKRWKRD